MQIMPVLDAQSRGSFQLAAADFARAAALRDAALATHPAMAFFHPPLNAASRRWLARSISPYRDEIEALADRIGPHGLFVLNLVYEWGCTTATAPDPAGGNRMLRVLDWAMPGIGRFGVIGKFRGPAGAFLAVTWPGYAGVLTAMAPGRFAAALNQPPAPEPSGLPPVDFIDNRRRFLDTAEGWPASHYLRRVCETAGGYDEALRLLSDERVALAQPALFILAGTKPEQASVIEASGRRRVVSPNYRERPGAVACANMWLGGTFRGKARGYAIDRSQSAEANNRQRRALGLAAVGRPRIAFDALPAPLLNPYTLQIAEMNAARRMLTACAMEKGRPVLAPVTLAA